MTSRGCCCFLYPTEKRKKKNKWIRLGGAKVFSFNDNLYKFYNELKLVNNTNLHKNEAHLKSLSDFRCKIHTFLKKIINTNK